MRINVKTLQGRDCYPVVTDETSVFELKCLVANEMDIPVERQRLVFQGKAMQDGMTLLQCGVKDSNKITLSIKEANKAENATVETKSASSSSPKTKLDLRRELYQILIKHFTPSDVQNLVEQFICELHDSLKSLSLDDIERIAQANLQNQKP